jgi:hypothetical protein
VAFGGDWCDGNTGGLTSRASRAYRLHPLWTSAPSAPAQVGVHYVQYVLNNSYATGDEVSRAVAIEREFAERMALFFEGLGGTRIMGLIYGWLTVSDPGHQSITEMAIALGVSKASISTVVRQLEQAQMVERVPVPGSRQHHYQLRSGGWAQVLRARVARLASGAAAADYGLAHFGPDRPTQRERLQEMRDFFAFVETEYGEVLARRWDEYRKKARDERAASRTD